MSISGELIAIAVVIGFGVMMLRLLFGESFLGVGSGRDVDRVARAGPGAELALGVFAAARLAAESPVSGAAYVLLGIAAALAALGRGGHLAAQGVLVVIGSLAGVAAYANLFTDHCGEPVSVAAIVVATLAVIVAVGVLVLRAVLGGFWARDLDLGAAVLGVFGLLEFAPSVVLAHGLPLLAADAGPWLIRAFLVALLLVVAVGVGLRPRFSAGVLAVALGMLHLGLLAAPGVCAVGVGPLGTATLVALVVFAVSRGVQRRR